MFSNPMKNKRFKIISFTETFIYQFSRRFCTSFDAVAERNDCSGSASLLFF